MVNHHILDGKGAGGLVVADERAQLSLGAECRRGGIGGIIPRIILSLAVVEPPHGDKAHAVGMVDGKLLAIGEIPHLQFVFTVHGDHLLGALAGTRDSGLSGRRGGTALRQPDEVDVRSDLALHVAAVEHTPRGARHLPVLIRAVPTGIEHRCIVELETVPIKALKHHAAIVSWPTLGQRQQRQQSHHKWQEKLSFHKFLKYV